MNRNEQLFNVKMVNVICATVIKGTGADGDPVRYVDRYYKPDGTMICDTDSVYNSSKTLADINVIHHIASCLKSNEPGAKILKQVEEIVSNRSLSQ